MQNQSSSSHGQGRQPVTRELILLTQGRNYHSLHSAARTGSSTVARGCLAQGPRFCCQQLPLYFAQAMCLHAAQTQAPAGFPEGQPNRAGRPRQQTVPVTAAPAAHGQATTPQTAVKHLHGFVAGVEAHVVHLYLLGVRHCRTSRTAQHTSARRQTAVTPHAGFEGRPQGSVARVSATHKHAAVLLLGLWPCMGARSSSRGSAVQGWDVSRGWLPSRASTAACCLKRRGPQTLPGVRCCCSMQRLAVRECWKHQFNRGAFMHACLVLYVRVQPFSVVLHGPALHWCAGRVVGGLLPWHGPSTQRQPLHPLLRHAKLPTACPRHHPVPLHHSHDHTV